MTPIALILFLKIFVSLIMVVAPFMLLPQTRLGQAMQVEPASPALFRLYGMAVLALLVGYAGGIWQVSNGVYPWGVVAMGIASNAGGFLTLIITGFAGRNRFLTGFFGFIAVALIALSAAPDMAMSPLF